MVPFNIQPVHSWAAIVSMQRRDHFFSKFSFQYCPLIYTYRNASDHVARTTRTTHAQCNQLFVVLLCFCYTRGIRRSTRT